MSHQPQTLIHLPAATRSAEETVAAGPTHWALRRVYVKPSDPDYEKSGRLRTAAPDDAADDLKIEVFSVTVSSAFFDPGARTVIILPSSFQRSCRSLKRA
jgi:hypothetical protein